MNPKKNLIIKRTLQTGGVILSLLTASQTLSAAEKSRQPYEESFDSTESVTVFKGYRAVESALSVNTEGKREGQACLQGNWTAADEGPGVGGLQKRFAPTDFTGKKFTLWVRPTTPDVITSFSVAFFDDSGKRVAIWHWFANTFKKDWKQVSFHVGEKGSASSYEGSTELTRVAKIQFYGTTRGPGQIASILWDDFAEGDGESAAPATSASAQPARPDQPSPPVTPMVAPHRAAVVPDKEFNVQTYGAAPDDGQPDTKGITAAIAAAQEAGGGVVYFPKGIYEIHHVSSLNGSEHQDGQGMKLQKIWFKGDGRDVSIVRSLDPGHHIFTLTGSEDLTFSEIAFDANGSLKFGGIRFYGCKRVTIENTRYFDGNVAARPAPTTNMADIYPYVFARGAEHNEDLIITDNLIEDLQLEVDKVRRAAITRNTIVRPIATAGIGLFSLQSRQVEGEDLCGEDVLIQNNTIRDLHSAMTGIAVHIDPPVHNVRGKAEEQSPVTNVIYRNIHLLGNTIEISRNGPRGIYAIKLGQTDMSRETAGVRYEGIRIENNRITVSPDADVRGGALVALHVSRPMENGGDFRFENTIIKDNVFQYAGSKPLFQIYGRGKNFVESGNRKEPASGAGAAAPAPTGQKNS